MMNEEQKPSVDGLMALLAEYGQYRWSEGVSDGHYDRVSARAANNEAVELSQQIRAHAAALASTSAKADRAVVSEYTIDGDPRRAGSDDIRIARAKQMEGPAKWAVRRMGECLNKQGEWEYEPMPSSRDDEFLARCRFDTAQLALDAAMLPTPPAADTKEPS